MDMEHQFELATPWDLKTPHENSQPMLIHVESTAEEFELCDSEHVCLHQKEPRKTFSPWRLALVVLLPIVAVANIIYLCAVRSKRHLVSSLFKDGAASPQTLWTANWTLTNTSITFDKYHNQYYTGETLYPFVDITDTPGNLTWFHNFISSFSSHWLPAGFDPSLFSYPPHASWEALWANLTSEAVSNACDAALHTTSTICHSNTGFGAILNQMVNEFLVAFLKQKPMQIFVHNIGAETFWVEQFQVSGLPVCPNISINAGCNASYMAQGMVLGKVIDNRKLYDVKRFLYSKLFKPNMVALGRANRLKMRLGLSHIPYVGIHIRRGDKTAEAGNVVVNTIDFCETAYKLCMAMMRCTAVFVASDDADEPLKVNRTFAWKYPFIRVVWQERLNSSLYSQREHVAPAEKANFMNDVLLLIQARGFVGTASSEVGRFVFFMRDERTQSISMDDYNNFMLRSG